VRERRCHCDVQAPVILNAAQRSEGSGHRMRNPFRNPDPSAGPQDDNIVWKLPQIRMLPQPCEFITPEGGKPFPGFYLTGNADALMMSIERIDYDRKQAADSDGHADPHPRQRAQCQGIDHRSPVGDGSPDCAKQSQCAGVPGGRAKPGAPNKANFSLWRPGTEGGVRNEPNWAGQEARNWGLGIRGSGRAGCQTKPISRSGDLEPRAGVQNEANWAGADARDCGLGIRGYRRGGMSNEPNLQAYRPGVREQARQTKPISRPGDLETRSARKTQPICGVGGACETRRCVSHRQAAFPAATHFQWVEIGAETVSCVCESILVWMCHPDPRRGRPPCLPASRKAIGCWAWRTRATTGGCPYGRAKPCLAQMGIALKSTQRRSRAGVQILFRRADGGGRMARQRGVGGRCDSPAPDREAAGRHRRGRNQLVRRFSPASEGSAAGAIHRRRIGRQPGGTAGVATSWYGVSRRRCCCCNARGTSGKDKE